MASTDSNSSDSFNELCPEIEQGIRNMYPTLDRTKVDAELDSLRTQSTDNKFPYSKYALLLFRRYAEAANKKIEEKDQELLDSIGVANSRPAAPTNPYAMDAFMSRTHQEVAPYINETCPNDILTSSGWEAVDRNIFKMRLAAFVFSFIAFVVLSTVQEIFKNGGIVDNNDFKYGCLFSQFTDTIVRISFVNFLLAWLYAMFSVFVTLGFLIYLLLPIDPKSGAKHIPGLDSLCNVNSCMPTEGAGGELMDGIYRVTNGMILMYNSFCFYCSSHPMHVMAFLDATMLGLAIATVVQARYGLYANIVVKMYLYEFTQTVVVETAEQEMFYNLQTFYETFSNFTETPCLYSNPVPAITAAIWMLTASLLVQCLIFRVSFQMWKMERDDLESKGEDIQHLAMSNEERMGLQQELPPTSSIANVSTSNDHENDNSNNQQDGSPHTQTHKVSPRKFQISDDDEEEQEEGDDLESNRRPRGSLLASQGGIASPGQTVAAVKPKKKSSKYTTDL